MAHILLPSHLPTISLKLQSSSRPGMSNFKQVVIDFLVSKLPVIYHPVLLPYLALSKNTGKNNTTHVVCCKSNILSRVGCITRQITSRLLHIANLFHIRSYTHTIYNLLITVIGSITITSSDVVLPCARYSSTRSCWTSLDSVISRSTLVTTGHIIGILHVHDTTALGDFLTHTVT
jgi:hypothetical protein